MGFIESVYKKLLEQKQRDTDEHGAVFITNEEIEDLGVHQWTPRRA
jgi:hypothetical protein